MNYMMFSFVAWNSWNMTPFDTKLKTFVNFSCRITQSEWRFTVHLMLWIIASHPPLVVTLNWCREKCVAKALWNWRHKTQFVSWDNVSPTVMGRIPLESLVMVKRRAVLRTRVIRSGMWPYAIWEQSWNNWENPPLNLGENNFEGIQKPS
jgi:hypothetical protein